MTRLERLYRALLRGYPAEFRDDYAAEMTQLYRDRESREPAGALWRDLLVDLARTAPKEQLHVLLADLRYTLRLMRRAPLFTASVVLTIAMGIGATTTMFTVVNAVLVRPLPFADPSRLVWVAEKNDTLHLPTFGASVLNYLSWRERTQTLDLAAIGFGSYNIVDGGEPEQFVGGRLTPSLLAVLGLQPILGRGFLDGEDAPGAPAVALLGEGVWKRRFGGDPSIVGRAVKLNGLPHTVVGIAPPGLSVLTGGDVWTPLTLDPAHEIRLNHVINVVARLKPHVTFTQAQADVDAVSADVGRQYPDVKLWGIRLVTFSNWLVAAPLRTALFVLLGAVACLLLIACANVANLLLVRAAGRQREMAVRTAIGASGSRLLRQTLVESLALSVIGGCIGVAAAIVAVRAIASALPPSTLPVPELPIDATVLVVAVVVTIATGLIFGIVPALQSSTPDVSAMLKHGARLGGTRRRLRATLAGAELALATLLLVGAGLLARSLVRLEHVPLGFRPEQVLTFQVSLPTEKYPPDGKAQAFYRELQASLQALPGTTGAAISSGVPLGNGTYTTTPVTPIGGSILPANTSVPIDWRTVSTGYFRTLGIALIRGRDFAEADHVGDPKVGIVSEETAAKLWGHDDPLGRVIRIGPRQLRIVGVVGDVHNTALNQDSPTVYIPMGMKLWSVMDVAVRTSVDPPSLLPTIRARVRALDAEVPLSNVRAMTEWVSASAAQPRLSASLLGMFAIAALALAAIGAYGVVAYSVSQRTREIGLRLALGAQRREVVGLVVREGMTVGVAGVAIGLVTALAGSRLLESLVFGIDVRDPATFAAVALSLLAVALAACAVPARRASRVDPMVALREE